MTDDMYIEAEDEILMELKQSSLSQLLSKQKGK